MTDLNLIMTKLATKFQPDAAADLAAVFQINVEDDNNYFIRIAQQQCTITPGSHPDPSVTLIMAAQTFAAIINGELSGTTAFMTGQLRAEGDVMLATRLSKLFKR